MPNIDVTATANVTPAITGLEKVGKELLVVSGVAEKASKSLLTLSAAAARIPAPFANTTKGIQAFNASLKTITPTVDQATTSVVKASSAIGTGLRTGSNQAAQALTNLGRVAQDAPFGFIGIANNLNPLLESFQRLKVETGSSGGALKALGSSLMGAGGIGLALSAVTAIVSFASVGFSAWTRGINGSKAALDANAKSAKEAADSYKSIVTEVAKEVGQVEILVSALTKENLSRKQREEAIKELQKISPQYFATLNAEKSTIEQITTAYDIYSRSIVRVIELKTREGQLNKVIEERLALQDKGNKSANITVDANGKIQKSYNAVLQAQDDVSKKGFNALILTQAEQAKLNQLLQTEAELLRQIGNLRSPSEFNIAPKKVKVKPDKVEIELPKKIDLLPQSESQELSRGTGATTIDTVITVRPEFIIDEDADRRLFEGLNALFAADRLAKFQVAATEAINQTMTNIVNDTIASTADAIGQALAGGKDTLPALFDNLIKGIGGQVSELGKYLVKVGIEMLAAKKAIEALGLTPQGAIIAGIGLQILGSLLKAAATKKTNQVGFASGGTVGESGFYNVGERGQERVFLPQGAKVQPNNEVMAYGGGNSNMVIAETRISGPDLVILMRRGEAILGRNN